MAKGYLKNPVETTIVCQYCDKEYTYTRYTSLKRKSCIDCVPEDRGNDAALLRRLVKMKAVRIKGHKCEVCGLVDDYCVYDFHHRDPNEKDFHLGDKTSTIKWEVVEKEIEKCMLVCANCHRKIHSENLKK